MKSLKVIKKRIKELEKMRDFPPMVIYSDEPAAVLSLEPGALNQFPSNAETKVLADTDAINTELAHLYWVITD